LKVLKILRLLDDAGGKFTKKELDISIKTRIDGKPNIYDISRRSLLMN